MSAEVLELVKSLVRRWNADEAGVVADWCEEHGHMPVALALRPPAPQKKRRGAKKPAVVEWPNGQTRRMIECLCTVLGGPGIGALRTNWRWGWLPESFGAGARGARGATGPTGVGPVGATGPSGGRRLYVGFPRMEVDGPGPVQLEIVAEYPFLLNGIAAGGAAAHFMFLGCQIGSRSLFASSLLPDGGAGGVPLLLFTDLLGGDDPFETIAPADRVVRAGETVRLSLECLSGTPVTLSAVLRATTLDAPYAPRLMDPLTRDQFASWDTFIMQPFRDGSQQLPPAPLPLQPFGPQLPSTPQPPRGALLLDPETEPRPPPWLTCARCGARLPLLENCPCRAGE